MYGSFVSAGTGQLLNLLRRKAPLSMSAAVLVQRPVLLTLISRTAMLACDDTVPISYWCGVGIHSTGCRLGKQ